MPGGVEVAQAYITIIPSMKGIQDTIEKEMGAEKVGESTGKKIGSSIASALGKAGKAVAKGLAVGTAAAATGITALTVSATKSYAQYEQLAGGIENLYGSSADQLKQYAQDAYKTAGMSANEYMQTATSFSAALIKSVNGDTAEAARLTDVAMKAMSDNVNTFGRSAEDVQNAIMGLSRENYTMLDNLSLGYAGTKEGMMQLINDSGVLGEKLTDTSQLGEVGFGKMIEAIQKVQEQQNIAGTTANEAAKTIEGSIGMTKAAWQNLVTELGKDDGDVPARVQEVVDSALLVVENVAPRVVQIVGAIITKVPPAIAANAPKVTQALTGMLDGATNGAFSKAVEKVKPYVERIGNAVKGMAERFKPLAPVVQEIGGKLGGILMTALHAVTVAFETIAPIIATIAEHALPILSSALGIAGDAFNILMTFIEPVANFLSDTFSVIIDTAGTALEGLADIIETVFSGISDAVDGAANFIKDPIGTITGLITGAGDTLTETGNKAAKSADKAAKSTANGYGKVNKSITDNTSKAASSANNNMTKAASSVDSQSNKAAGSAEKNGSRIKTAWDKSYTTKMNAKANTSSAESQMSGFKNRWSGFNVNGYASVDTSGASSSLSSWISRASGFVVSGVAKVTSYLTGGHAEGAIIYQKHADGFIANRPGAGVDITKHIAGEAGAEAVIPLTNRRYVAPFAQTVADFINEDRGGVTITGNTFIVRNDSDITAIGRAINQETERKRRAKL